MKGFEEEEKDVVEEIMQEGEKMDEGKILKVKKKEDREG